MDSEQLKSQVDTFLEKLQTHAPKQAPQKPKIKQDKPPEKPPSEKTVHIPSPTLHPPEPSPHTAPQEETPKSKEQLPIAEFYNQLLALANLLADMTTDQLPPTIHLLLDKNKQYTLADGSQIPATAEVSPPVKAEPPVVPKVTVEVTLGAKEMTLLTKLLDKLSQDGN